MLQFISNEHDVQHHPSTSRPANSYSTSPSPLPAQPSTPPFRASDHADDGKKHLLLAASGSVASIKIPQILNALSVHSDLSIRLLLTPSAASFLAGQSDEQPALSSLLTTIPNLDAIYYDADEWRTPWVRNAPILHIELRRWADLLLIAPLSANMLAKIVGGLADGLLASVVRAWDTTGMVDGAARFGLGQKRIVVAPAMNTAMFRQPITQRQIRVLEEEWGVGKVVMWAEESGGIELKGWFEVLKPVAKELACGDVGDGAMREWKEIVKIVEERMLLGRERAPKVNLEF